MHADLADLRVRDEHLTAGLDAFGSMQPKGILARLGSPTASVHLLCTGARELLRDVRTYGWLLIAWALIAAVGYLSLLLGQDRLGWLVAQIGVLAAPLLVVWQRLRSWHRSSGGVTNQVCTELEQRRRQIRQDATELTARLAEVDAAVRLSAFLDARSTPSTYQEYRGLLGQVHRDLQQLDVDLRAAHRQWDENPTPTPPLERIILYIDDLDRCPPRRVVEVLAAVHLMLALPLFVVVVAVDPRWLLSSLGHHYRELFTAADPTEGPGDDEDLATPLDYLDKIFQIPFAVAPLRDTAASGYLRVLLGSGHAQAAPAAGPATTGPATTGPVTTGLLATELTISAPRRVVRPSSDAPRRGGPRSGAEPRPTVVPDLRPRGLRISPAEVDFLARLGALLPTPRSAKKLVNLYRLIRIGVSEADLPAFLDEHAHQPVHLLLALLVGTPNDAQVILTAILAADPAADLVAFLGGAAAPGVRPAEWDATAETRQQLAEVLERLHADLTPPPPATLAPYQRWCPRIARYSFHTRTLAKPRRSQTSSSRSLDTDRRNSGAG